MSATFPDDFGGYVYFIRPICGGLVKIGHTCDLDGRLNVINGASPVKCEILSYFTGGIIDERTLHYGFRDACDHGEWFRPIKPLLRMIQLAKACSSGLFGASVAADGGSLLRYGKLIVHSQRTFKLSADLNCIDLCSLVSMHVQLLSCRRVGSIESEYHANMATGFAAMLGEPLDLESAVSAAKSKQGSARKDGYLPAIPRNASGLAKIVGLS